jgi:hypothetical protein
MESRDHMRKKLHKGEIHTHEEREEFVNYIRNMTHMGLNRGEIMHKLCSRGMSKHYAESLLEYVSHNDKTHTDLYLEQHKQNPDTTNEMPWLIKLSIFVAILVIIIMTVFIATANLKQEPRDVAIKYEVNMASEIFYSSESLAILTNYKVIGTTDKVPVTIYYRLIDSKQDIVLEWSESKKINGDSLATVKRMLPSNIERGKYYIYSEMNHADRIFSSRSEFFDII